jgi:uncharacterized protein YbjT (DUF2867 family)
MTSFSQSPPEPSADLTSAAPSPLPGPVVVTGATGRQGGAVVRQLLRAGITVRALTRDPHGPAAHRLRAAGAHPVSGDLRDPATLPAVLDGAHGVFSVQNYWDPAVGHAGEIAQAHALAIAARTAGVRHFVQSTMADAPGTAPLPRHFHSKQEIERAIDDLGLARTYLGTVFFMDNVDDPAMGGSMLFPMLSGTLRPDTRLHLLAVADIGAAATHAFLHPDQFLGRKVNLAGDRLSVGEMKQTYQQITGRRPRRWPLPSGAARLLNREFTEQLRWHNQVNFTFDPLSERPPLLELTTFAQFLRTRTAASAGAALLAHGERASR